jgi:pimeloyl-ACP methyl ester carboxylesterase
MDLHNIRVQGQPAGFSTGRSGVNAGRPNVVLVHGSGGSSLSWFMQLNSLNLDLNLIAVDLPGHGDTPGLPVERVEDYTAWLKEFIEAAQIAPCFAVGHSLGGAIVQRLTLDHPALLKGIVLVGTGVRLRVSPRILEGIHQDFDKTVSFIVSSCYTKEAPEELIQDAFRLARRTTSAQLRIDFMACDRFNIMDEVEQIQLPTLIIVGREDIMTPVKYSEFLNRKIAGSRLVVLDNAGHAVMHQSPEAFNQALSEFVLV